MALDLGTLVGYLKLDTSGWDAPAQKTSKAIPGWMGAAVATGMAVVSTALYKVGEQFDDVTDTIRTGTGATGKALDGLVQSAKNVGTQVPAEFAKIGPTIADLNTRLGLTGDTLETVASQYLEAGRILGEDVDIQTTTAAFSAFGIEGEAVIGAMDTLFQVSQATGVGMNELAGNVQQVAPALQAVGFSFEDSIALMGSLDKAGLNSSQIAAGLSRSLVNLAKDGEAPEEAFNRVVGELQGFVDTGDEAAALDLAGKIFGTRGASQFVGALQSGVLNMEDLMAATGATGDTILGVGEETMDFAERWQLLMNEAMVAIEPLATAVFTAIGDGLAAVMPHLSALGQWMQDNPELVNALAIAAGVLAAAFVVLSVAQWAVNAAMFASPITWIVLAIVALIAIIVLLVANWDAVVAFLSEIWAGFVSWITEVIDGFASWWNEVWAGFASWITSVWEGFVGWITGVWEGFISWVTGVIEGFAAWWDGLWSSIGSFIESVWSGFVGFVQGVWQGFVGWIMGVLSGFIVFWSGIWESVSSSVRDIWAGIISWFQGIPDAIFNVFMGAATWLYNIGRDIVNGLWNGLKSIWNSVAGWFEDTFGGIIDVVGGIFQINSPSRVFREIGQFVGQGFIDGLDGMNPDIDAAVEGAFGHIPGDASGTPQEPAGGPGSRSGDFHYHAAEGQSLSSEEALFAALGSPRTPFGGNA